MWEPQFQFPSLHGSLNFARMTLKYYWVKIKEREERVKEDRFGHPLEVLLGSIYFLLATITENNENDLKKKNTTKLPNKKLL